MLRWFFPFLSFLLYIVAPKDYSLGYNITLLVVFVFNFILLAGKYGYKLFSYTTLFFMTFFFMDFVYPIFIYPYDPTFILQFRYSFSVDYINKGTALCGLAFSMFVGGYVSKVKPLKSSIYELQLKRYQAFTIVSYLVLLYNLYIIIPQLGTKYGEAAVPFQSGSLFVMLECTLAMVICYTRRDVLKNSLHNFIHILRPHLIASGTFCMASLMLGSREYVLVLTLLYIFLFTKYVRPLSFMKLCLGVVIGMIGLYYISQVRNYTGNQRAMSDGVVGEIFEYKSWQSNSVSSIWNLASDLIINNRNVYVGMQYVDDPDHGYTLGVNYIPNLLSPVPFLPSAFSTVFLGKPPVECTSQQILTNYTRDDLGHSDLDYELGTNCVVDVYMGWGLIGVMLLFLMLGRVIRRLEISDNNLPILCIYVILLTTVIFFCRSSFFGPVRNVVWSYLMCIIMLRRYRMPEY